MNKQCSICGFSDEQDTMIKDEAGQWVHRECEEDALQGEFHQRPLDADDDDHEQEKHDEQVERERVDNFNQQERL